MLKYRQYSIILRGHFFRSDTCVNKPWFVGSEPQKEVVMKFSALILSCAALVATNIPANSAVTKYDCKSEQCNYRYSQKPMGTREYWSQCVGKNIDYTRHAGRASCQSSVKPMTCTVSISKWSGYDSCSCTNWSLTKKVDAKISIHCPRLP